MKSAIRKLLNKYNLLILGGNIFSPLRKRLFLHSLWAAIILALLGDIVDIVMDFPLVLIIITSITILILLYIFLKIRLRPNTSYEKYISVFIGMIILIMPMNWVLNAGIDGNSIQLLVLAFMCIFFIVKPESRFKTFLLFLVMLEALILLDFYYPKFIVRYTDVNQRFTDLVLGHGFYLTIAYVLLNIILKNTEYEQTRIRFKNTQLDTLAHKYADLNKELNKTVEELATSNLLKDRFITFVSHDLRSPLVGVVSLARLMEKDFDKINETDKKDYINQLRISLERQHRFLDELLLWGKLQRNKAVVNKETTDINLIIDSAVEILKENISQKNIRLDISYCDDPMVCTDSQLIATVFRNIISNAIKFSYPESTIKISAETEGRNLIIAFKDHGTGMPEDELRNLFKLDEYFSREGTEGEKGSGLGMIVCAEIMSRINGSIRAESEEGNGTAFFVQIPYNGLP